MKSITSLVLLMSSFSITAAQPEQIQIRIHGDAALPTLIYLPGLHGDWTLMSSFRVAVESKVRFVEFTYPRTLEWSLENYAEAVEKALAQNGITHGWLLGESFSSQVAWTMVGRTQKTTSQFCIDGIILSAGFVKHPNRLGVAFAEKFSGRLPRPCFDAFLSVYATYGKFRHRHAPET